MKETYPYIETHAELIELCKAGDNLAFKELYHSYNKAMFNIAMRMLTSKEEAEDALQESFISAFKKINDYSGAVSFGSWLKRIVINRCIDILRKKNLDLIPLGEKDLPEEENEVDEQTIIYTVNAIKEAVQQLPDGYRLVLTLYLFEDYSHKKIAEELGISEGTSKSQYARARKKLLELIISKNQKS